MNSNPQKTPFPLTIGALGYVTRSDITASSRKYLAAGSQNMLINETAKSRDTIEELMGETTDEEGDKIVSRDGYTMLGAESEDRDRIVSEFKFKTKVGTTIMGRMDANGDLEFYSETSSAWETLLTGLDGDNPLRWTTVWNATETLRLLLFVNHSSTLYEWSGATATLASVAAGTITINESIGTRGFLTAGTRSIRIKDSGGTWRETVYTGQSGSQFTVSTDLSGFTFDANALVVQVVRTNANTPASGFTNDVIKTLDNHVYVGSHSSSVVYMSKSTSYTDFTFSSPRLATDGWQFVLDAFTIGFETNVAGSGEESMIMFAGEDWIYRVEFVDLGDGSTIAQIARVKPIVVSPGQGAVSQELIAKLKNSIVFLNGTNELLELGTVEDKTTITQTPLSDPIKPDFVAANFTGGSIRFRANNLYITAAGSGRLFILAFREDSRGSRRFWQPPQILPVGQMTDYGGYLIGHSNSLTESYKLFDGTNDNGQPISFKAHFPYASYGAREKHKNFSKYFQELYMTANAIVRLILVYEFLGAKAIKTYELKGTESDFIFTPVPQGSLGVNSLGTASLGSVVEALAEFLKYRRFKKVVPIDHFECQTRYECDELDARFQILAHGPDVVVSKTAPAKFTN